MNTNWVKKKYIIILTLVMLGIVVIGGIFSSISYKKNTEFKKIVQQIVKYNISEFDKDKEKLIEEWEDTGLFNLSEKKAIIDDITKLEEEVEEANNWITEKLEEVTVIENEKDNYNLTEAFTEYDKFINEYIDSLTNKEYKSAKEYDDKYEKQLNNIIEANNKYIEEKISIYEALDLSIADITDKENFESNINEIKKSLKDNKYTNIVKLFEALDEIALVYVEPERELAVQIQQIDASSYPNVKLYAQISDINTNEVPKLESEFFFVRKEDANANYVNQTIKKISQLNEVESLNVNIVADVSDSMMGQPIREAKGVMSDFISNMQFSVGDLVELTSFNTGVHIEQEFTNSEQTLINKINNLTTDGMTSLYDALYTAVTRVAGQSGAKCVIAFTDGLDNTSSCTMQEVIDTAKRYHVPIFIIGIGNNEYSQIGRIARETEGEYYGIQNIFSMTEIYNKIYKHQKELYMIEFEDTVGNLQDKANVVVGFNSSQYGGKINYSYTPNVLLSVQGEAMFDEGPEKVVEGYIKNFDDAMSKMDFSYISKYLKEGSNIYNSQKKYIETNISETLDLYEIVSTNYINNDSCVVTTRETFYVQRENEALELMTQECKYIVERENDEWKMVDFADSVKVISRVNR